MRVPLYDRTWVRYEEGSGWWKWKKHQKTPTIGRLPGQRKHKTIRQERIYWIRCKLILWGLAVFTAVSNRGRIDCVGDIGRKDPYGMNRIFLSCIRISKLWDSIVPYFIRLIPISFSSFCLRVVESQLRDVLSERQIMKNHEKQLLARYQLPIAWSHLKLQ